MGTRDHFFPGRQRYFQPDCVITLSLTHKSIQRIRKLSQSPGKKLNLSLVCASVAASFKDTAQGGAEPLGARRCCCTIQNLVHTNPVTQRGLHFRRYEVSRTLTIQYKALFALKMLSLTKVFRCFCSSVWRVWDHLLRPLRCGGVSRYHPP